MSAEKNPRLYPHWTHSRYVGLTRLRQAIEGMVEKHVAPLGNGSRELTAVDLGCGTMPYRELFGPFVARYLGADLPGNALAELPIDAATGRVPMPNGSADIVISSQVLEHVESPASYLAEARRLCQPDGLLILSTHGFWLYHPNPRDYWRWTADGLKKTLRDTGWEVVEMTGILGFAATALCLLQDALAPIFPGPVRAAFCVAMQRFVQLSDSFYTPETRRENAAVYLAVARPAKNFPQ